jgi:putative hemolysin
MTETAWPQLLLVGALVLLNGILAGSEMAFISLRETQLSRLERTSGAGKLVVRLARHPNRFLATIQIGITLAGFLASATAAVTLAESVVGWFSLFGGAADSVAIVAVTLILSYFTLVLGELVPKRLALQWAEPWALIAALPLSWLAAATKPVVWLLSVSTDLVVRLFGGKPGAARQEVDLEELRDMVLAHRALSEDHQEVLVGAIELAERDLRQVLRPRSEVVTIEASAPVRDGIDVLLVSGHSRAPVIEGDDLDDAVGVAHLRDLVTADPGDRVGDRVREAPFFPGSVPVLTALRRMQESRQQMAFVIEEFGGIDGIVTVEDLIEELVGEIYDESDRDVLGAKHGPNGTILVPGSFPMHDLPDLGITAPPGDYTTVAGLVLDRLGRLPGVSGDQIDIEGWQVTVRSLRRRGIGQVEFRRQDASPDASPPDSFVG